MEILVPKFSGSVTWFLWTFERTDGTLWAQSAIQELLWSSMLGKKIKESTSALPGIPLESPIQKPRTSTSKVSFQVPRAQLSRLISALTCLFISGPTDPHYSFERSDIATKTVQICIKIGFSSPIPLLSHFSLLSRSHLHLFEHVAWYLRLRPLLFGTCSVHHRDFQFYFISLSLRCEGRPSDSCSVAGKIIPFWCQKEALHYQFWSVWRPEEPFVHEEQCRKSRWFWERIKISSSQNFKIKFLSSFLSVAYHTFT